MADSQNFSNDFYTLFQENWGRAHGLHGKLNSPKNSLMKRKASSTALKRPRTALTDAQKKEVQRQVNTTIARNKDYMICTFEQSADSIQFTGKVYDLLGAMIRGDNARNNFSGAHIQVKNIHIRGVLVAADTGQAIRLVLFQWLDDTSPTVTSVLDNAGIIGTVNAPYATRNWSTRSLYKILRDEIIILQNNPTLTGGNGFTRVVDYYAKGPKIAKTFYAATSNVLQKGGLYMIAVSDSGAAGHPTITFTAEMIYTDE